VDTGADDTRWAELPKATVARVDETWDGRLGDIGRPGGTRLDLTLNWGLDNHKTKNLEVTHLIFVKLVLATQMLTAGEARRW
jgi:hypothetical protein